VDVHAVVVIQGFAAPFKTAFASFRDSRIYMLMLSRRASSLFASAPVADFMPALVLCNFSAS
jgi:hypothetical protein